MSAARPCLGRRQERCPLQTGKGGRRARIFSEEFGMPVLRRPERRKSAGRDVRQASSLSRLPAKDDSVRHRFVFFKSTGAQENREAAHASGCSVDRELPSID